MQQNKEMIFEISMTQNIEGIQGVLSIYIATVDDETVNLYNLESLTCTSSSYKCSDRQNVYYKWTKQALGWECDHLCPSELLYVYKERSFQSRAGGEHESK